LAHITLHDDLRIYYESIDGDGDLPCLMFLHEGLGCTAMWKDFPRRLCRLTGCAGLVYDRLGYGRSSPLAAPRTIHYLHAYALQELPRVIAALLPERPIVLVGHSDGGTIALLHSAERPPYLAGIITEAAHVFVESVTLDGIRAAVTAFENGRLGGLVKYHGERSEAVFRAWSDTWLSDWFAEWNIEYALSAINVPLLVIQGREDQYATERQVHTIVTRSGGPATPALIDRCSHVPHLEQPEVVLQLMADFIKAASSPSSTTPPNRRQAAGPC
jgi:pimeloyl-ACP methyl ester carboxylesterase